MALGCVLQQKTKIRHGPPVHKAYSLKGIKIQGITIGTENFIFKRILARKMSLW